MRRLWLLPLLAVVLAGAWLAPLDASATRQVESGLARAVASFAAARALNAAISVAQGTEVAVHPAGVGVSLAPGQALDPINDLVEQFALLMLGASVSFGVQLALIKMGAFWAVSLLLSAVALAWTWATWRERSLPLWLTRLFVGLLLVRFAVPLVALGNEAAFRLFLSEDYRAGQATIELSSREIASAGAPGTPVTPEPAPAPGGLGEKLQNWWDSAASKVDVSKRLDELKEAAGGAIDDIVRLIVVFLLQTVVLPLLLLWGLLRLGRALCEAPPAKPP
ncbi:MAG: hypothetical protein H0W40_18685 [Methylibium sp.]|uniref:hypothetical protein n=1 Tax=Methylibium sp. TaxID=2067992 RepID=UPI0017F3A54B|nr:hypothetical protein [Methylibium sp.]MBA3599376.1 hypothetical protein [Methylibium sp.]